MKIFLIRHGCTAGNLEHRYVGTTDEPLTKEAMMWFREHRELYPQPDLLFASPLQRCTQTARLLYPEMEIRLLANLRECGFGEFEYKNYEDLRDDGRYQAWIDGGGTTAFPGGESRAAFIERSCRAFLEGCARAKREGAASVAFVVHGGTIMAILDRFSDPHRDYFDWQVKNAEGFACEWTQSHMISVCPIPKTPGLTGIEDEFVMQKNQRLRCGYTTGSCAAAAASAAAQMLLTGHICYRVDLVTPKGIRLHLPVEEQKMTESQVSCAVRKYAGDDPDVTDGILVYACAERLPGPEKEDPSKVKSFFENREEETARISPDEKEMSDLAAASMEEPRIVIEGGIGVGRVTKPGLEQPVGEAAINRVPRQMITQEVEAVCERWEYPGRLKLTISVPEGVEIAKRTFNPHLGIEGGISILGTSGIVVPMSEAALIESIRVEMRQKVAQGEDYILITPGNYGADFIRRGGIPDVRLEEMAQDSMKCSNYVGKTLDIAQELGVKGILFVAHIGKFIKVSGGVMNTHSAQADCRAELIAAQAMRVGTPPDIVRRLLDTNTTEEAVGILLETGWLKQTIKEVTERICFHLQKHCKSTVETEVILFSNQYGYLGESEGAQKMIQKIGSFKYVRNASI